MRIFIFLISFLVLPGISHSVIAQQSTCPLGVGKGFNCGSGENNPCPTNNPEWQKPEWTCCDCCQGKNLVGSWYKDKIFQFNSTIQIRGCQW